MKIYKKHKFGAKKTIVDGIKFDSIGESEYYLVLKHQEKLGLIKCLELQSKVYLSDAKILLKPDFKFIRDGKTIYQDFKGMITPVFAIKARLWKAYMNCPLELVKRKGRHFRIEKIIEGKNEKKI